MVQYDKELSIFKFFINNHNTKYNFSKFINEFVKSCIHGRFIFGEDIQNVKDKFKKAKGIKTAEMQKNNP